MSEQKVSFCITCDGRLHHLKQTLRKNMEAVANYPSVEFVLLDYGSEDGLADWVKENFQKEIESGVLVYARYESEYFKMAHAKNMAHRLASGGILCNLDADNYLGSGYADWLNSVHTNNPKSYTRIHTLMIDLLKPSGLTGSGMLGRISVEREVFYAVAGYNELYKGWGDDGNFASRIEQLLGIKRITVPLELIGSIINHGNDERVVNLDNDTATSTTQKLTKDATNWSVMARQRLGNSWEWYRSLRKVEPANPDGNFGCGTVVINFGAETRVLEPLPTIQSRNAPCFSR